MIFSCCGQTTPSPRAWQASDGDETGASDEPRQGCLITFSGYDSLGQVTNAVRKWADGTNVVGQSYSYLFDDIGNRKTSGIGVPPVQSEYTVNLLNQYSSRTVPGAFWETGSAHTGAVIEVNGDTNVVRHGEYFAKELTLANTNAAVYTSLVTIAAMTYNGTNVVVTNTGSAFLPKTPEIFTHDADGNLTQDGRWTYQWDGENRLISMETSASVTSVLSAVKTRLEFAYDAGSRRIQKKVYSWNTDSWLLTSDLRFVYDGWNLIAELDATNGLVRSYTWGLDLSGSLQGAGGIGGLLSVTAGTNGTHFVAFDGNGNVTALVDASSGSISAQYEYSPFGEMLRATGPMAKANPFRWSSKYTDDETGLVMYPMRPYSPSTGRWLTKDPIEEKGGLNVYVFVINDPLNHWDPLGLAVGFYQYDYNTYPYTWISQAEVAQLMDAVNNVNSLKCGDGKKAYNATVQVPPITYQGLVATVKSSKWTLLLAHGTTNGTVQLANATPAAYLFSGIAANNGNTFLVWACYVTNGNELTALGALEDIKNWLKALKPKKCCDKPEKISLVTGPVN